MVSYYDYKQLERNALECGDQSDLNALGEWFERFGSEYWTGEVFKIDKNHSLRPIYDCFYDENGDFDYSSISGYELV